jgi:hypothetical protein
MSLKVRAAKAPQEPAFIRSRWALRVISANSFSRLAASLISRGLLASSLLKSLQTRIKKANRLAQLHQAGVAPAGKDSFHFLAVHTPSLE